MQWKSLYLFISSTFNDMHGERDYLVKTVFPELAQWCEARRLHLVDIDLRWGVTAEESRAKNTVLACLSNIDQCRPFFMCLLGQRRGWIPNIENVSDATYQHYPEIGRCVGKRSITEIEIEHALLAPFHRIADGTQTEPNPVRHTLFLLRNDCFGDVLSSEQENIYRNTAAANPTAQDTALEEFRSKILREQPHAFCYDCRFDQQIVSPELLSYGRETAQGRLVDFTVQGRPLNELVLSTLQAQIEQEFPYRQPQPPQNDTEEDAQQQALFIENNTAGFIPRAGEFDHLNRFLSDEGTQLLVLTSPHGYGKTMLLANFVREAQANGRRVIARFCGASDLSGTAFELWRSIMDEAGIRCPVTLDQLYGEFQSLLGALCASGECLIVLDGITQLDDGFDLLFRLPAELPKGFKLIASMADGPQAQTVTEDLQSDRHMEHIRLQPFAREADKRALIESYLARYLKNLEEIHIQAICALPASDNPLYLKILLSELRVFGVFREMENEIRRIGVSVSEAFQYKLNRMESDSVHLGISGEQAVSRLFGLLAYARNGLREEELLFCFRREFQGATDDTLRGAIRVLLRQQRMFMARRNGCVDYLYDSFKRVAQERYTCHAPRFHQLLKECFQHGADSRGNRRYEGDNARSFQELPYHMHCLGIREALLALLLDYFFVSAKVAHCGVNACIADNGLYANQSEVHRLMRDCLVLASATLKADPGRFTEQMRGRLCRETAPEIQAFLAQAARAANAPWLNPLTCVWTPPGHGLTDLYFVDRTQKPPEPVLFENRLFLFSSSACEVIDFANRKRKTLHLHTQGDLRTVVRDGGKIYLLIQSEVGWFAEVWDAKTARYICARPIPVPCLSGELAILGDEAVVASGNEELSVLDKETFAIVRTLRLESRIAVLESVHMLLGMWNEPSETMVPWKLAAADGTIAVAFSNGLICLYEIETGVCSGFFDAHKDHVMAMTFHEGRLYSGGADGKTIIWNMRTKALEQSLDLVTSGIGFASGFAVTKGGYDGKVTVRDPVSFQPVGVFTGHGSAIQHMTVDIETLCTVGYDQTIRVWDVRACQTPQQIGKHTFGIWAMLKRGSIIMTGSGDRTIRFWDSRTVECQESLKAHTERICALELIGHTLVSASHDGLARFWFLSDDAITIQGVINAQDGSDINGNYFTALAADRTQGMLFCQRDGTVIRKSAEGDIQTKAHTSEISKAIPNGGRLYTCSFDGTAAVLDLQTLSVLSRFAVSKEKLHDMILRNDQLILACGDGAVRVVNLADGSCSQTIRAHEAPVLSLAWSGDCLITGCGDGEIKLWDMQNAVCHSTFHLDYAVNKLLSDGGQLYAGLDDGSLFGFRVELVCPVTPPG